MSRSIILAAVAVVLPGLTPQDTARTVARFDFEVADGPALSPDGRYLAVGAWERGLLVVDVATGRHWTVLRGEIGSVDWSPRGDHLAFGRWDEEAQTYFIWTLPIDPATGRATGEARRVSVSSGDVVAFSPDGGSIAFADWNSPGQRLVVVPARGGRERILAQAERNIYSIAWSDDGAWIYYAHNVFGSPRAVVGRVRAGGGAAEVVWETPSGGPRVTEPGPMIVQPEAGQQFGFSREAGSPHTSPAVSQGGDYIRVLDRTGRNVLTTLLPPPGADASITTASRDRTRFYGMQSTQEFRLMALSLTDGSSRMLDAGPVRQTVGTSTSGDRIVFLTEVEGALGFVAMSLDGSGRREYRPGSLPATRPMSDNWHRFVVSPDGNHLAYTSLDTINHLVVLDLRTGRERVLASAGRLQFRWTSNDALQVERLESRLRRSRRSIHLVTLGGTDRLLRVIAEESTLGETSVTLVNDTLAFLASRERVELLPLPAGEARVVFRGHNAGPVSLSPDGRYLAIRTVNRLVPRYGREPDFIDETDAIAIVDLATGQRRDLQLDLISPRLGGPAVWHPDARHLVITLARSSGERDTYLVPINGDRPRVLARDVVSNWPYPQLLEGGNTMLVTVGGPFTSAIVELSAGAGVRRSSTGRK